MLCFALQRVRYGQLQCDTTGGLLHPQLLTLLHPFLFPRNCCRSSSAVSTSEATEMVTPAAEALKTADGYTLEQRTAAAATVKCRSCGIRKAALLIPLLCQDCHLWRLLLLVQSQYGSWSSSYERQPDQKQPSSLLGAATTVKHSPSLPQRGERRLSMIGLIDRPPLELGCKLAVSNTPWLEDMPQNAFTMTM